MYLAMDKGPINPHHVLILPIEHRANTLDLSSAAYGELERYFSALRTCFASQVMLPAFVYRDNDDLFVSSFVYDSTPY